MQNQLLQAGAINAPAWVGVVCERLDGLEKFMNADRALVTVVDDDESVRESLPVLLGELGYAALAFASAESFLASGALAQTRCLILDVAMPGMSGPALYRELRLRGTTPPAIFITARNDEALRGSLLALGAIACLFKPFDEQELCAALAAAIPAD